MNTENNSTANFTKAMKTDNIARTVVMFFCLIIYVCLLIWPFFLLNGKPAFSNIGDVKAYLGMAVIFLMIASIPLGIVHLLPGFPKYSTLSLRKRFFRGLNTVVKFLLFIPVIGWMGCLMIVTFAYLCLPITFGYFAGPVYMIIDLIRFIQKKPLVYNYEIPKYLEEPPIM